MNSTSHDGDGRTEFDALSPGAMLRINQACDAFEQLWRRKAGISAGLSIDDLLIHVGKLGAEENNSEQRALIFELVTLDIQYRRLHSLPIPIDQYAAHFPCLDDAFLKSLVASTVSDGALDGEALEPNQRLGDYIIRKRIGAGGMGQVYQAEHALMGRNVAIKVLTKTLQNDAIAKRRFEREVRSVAKLSHPNIVTAFDARRDNGILYLVTEWIEGRDLAELVASAGPLTIDDSIDYVLQAIDGLEYAHQQGLIHRDIKPSNLLLDTAGRIKILDLGLAKIVWASADEKTLPDALTKSTQILGTAGFIAPEQARNPLLVDPQSDIYSLGCTFYFLLTGSAPYTAATHLDMIVSHLSAPIPEIGEFITKASPALADLIRSMLAKSPSDRHKSMASVGAALRDIQSDRRRQASSGTEAFSIESNNAATMTKRSIQRRVMLGFGVLSLMLLFLEMSRRTWRMIAGTGNETEDRRVILERGLAMNGRSSFAEVKNFSTAFSGPAMAEALVTPESGSLPSNVISWTGRDAFVLFISAQREWGVALMHNGLPRLQVCVEKLRWNQSYLVAGVWEEPELSLYVDGTKVETKSIDYHFQPKRTSLCFGGVPEGLFPIQHGTRFFSGVIHAIRISTGERLTPAMTAADLLKTQKQTLALFPFKEGKGSVSQSQSRHRWEAELFDTTWHDSSAHVG